MLDLFTNRLILYLMFSFQKNYPVFKFNLIDKHQKTPIVITVLPKLLKEGVKMGTVCQYLQQQQKRKSIASD